MPKCDFIKVALQISSRLTVGIMLLIINTNGWSDLIKLYPSIVSISSSLWIEEFRSVSDRHIMS